MGDLNSSDDSATGNAVEIPSRDKNTALTLLLEFAVQKGSLNEMLDMVRLLLTIWTLGRERQDNRTGSGKVESSAPLIPFLRRLEAIEPQREFATLNEDHDNVENNADINDNDNENENEPFVSATEAFLR